MIITYDYQAQVWSAKFSYYGRTVLAEGKTREEAWDNAIQCAADQAAERMMG